MRADRRALGFFATCCGEQRESVRPHFPGLKFEPQGIDIR